MKNDPCRHCGKLVKRDNGKQCYSCIRRLQPNWNTPSFRKLAGLRAQIWQMQNRERHLHNQKRSQLKLSLLAKGLTDEQARAEAWARFPVFSKEKA